MNIADRVKADAESLAWRMSLKPGDQFTDGITGRFQGCVTIHEVQRTTGSQIITRQGRRFWIEKGTAVGESYHRIRAVTQEDRDGIERRRLYQWLNSCKFDTLDLETLKRIEAAYNPDGEKGACTT